MVSSMASVCAVAAGTSGSRSFLARVELVSCCLESGRDECGGWTGSCKGWARCVLWRFFPALTLSGAWLFLMPLRLGHANGKAGCPLTSHCWIISLRRHFLLSCVLIVDAVPGVA